MRINKRFGIVALLFLFVLTGCTSEVVINNQLQYDETIDYQTPATFSIDTNEYDLLVIEQSTSDNKSEVYLEFEYNFSHGVDDFEYSFYDENKEIVQCSVKEQEANIANFSCDDEISYLILSSVDNLDYQIGWDLTVQ